MNALLRLVHVNAGYGAVPVIIDINLDVARGEYLYLRGANGSGKSTLLRVISGALPQSSGDIFWANRSIRGFDVESRFNLGIGHLRQRRNTFDQLTVYTMWRVCHRGSHQAFKARLRWLLELWPELSNTLHTPIGLLSGGMRQAAALGAVVINPRSLLLLDEPTGGLTMSFAKAILDGIERIREHDSCSILLVDHNHHMFSDRKIDRVLTMETGRLVQIEVSE